VTEPRFNPSHGPNGRTGGPYLDDEMIKQHEIDRARVEGREPNFKNMVGGPVSLVGAQQLVDEYHRQPSEHDKPLASVDSVKATPVFYVPKEVEEFVYSVEEEKLEF
jgi:hypothetical protein